jgi:uncharacterized protein YdaU (DUF1376 family)
LEDYLNAPPAFQFYPDDFIGGTVDLSPEDCGSYIRLLCYQWGRGQIPGDRVAIARVCGCQPSEEVLAKFPDRKNPRLERERQKQIEYKASQSNSGKVGAEKRWGRHSEPIISPMANGMAKNSSPSPSPSPSPSSVSNGEGEVASLARAQKPSIEAIKLQAAKIGLAEAEAEKFFNYYESNGWRVGKNPMKSWSHALQNWKSNLKNYGTSQNGQKPNPRNAGVVGDLAANARRTAEIIRQRQAEAEANQSM